MRIVHTQHVPPKVRITIVILICTIIGAGWLVAASKGEKNELITSVSIESVTEKFHNEDGYYLTVILDDSVVKSYHLHYDRVSLKTGRRIYDKDFPDENFVGVSLKIASDKKLSHNDVGLILKEKQTDLCEIISVTKADNTLIVNED